MLLALIGLNEFEKEERIARFWEEAGNAERRVFFGNTVSIGEIAEAGAPSFFGPGASVLLRHAELMLAEEQRNLADFLKGFQGNLAVDFTEVDKRSVLYKTLEKLAKVEIFEPPKYTEGIQKWVINHVQNHFRKKINIDTARYIADAIGADTKRINAEIKKIFLYNSEIKEINMEHASLFIKQNREVPAFELQDSFGFRNIKVFLPKFRRIIREDGDEAFMPIVSALRSHSLTLLHIKSMKAKRMPDWQIRTEALPPNKVWTYEKNRLSEQSSNWSIKTLQKTILFLDELSYGKKMGSYRDLPSFELSICGLFGRN